MRLVSEALPERLRQSRFPDPRLGRDQHDASGTRFRVRPSALQQFEFLVATDEWALARAQRFEPAADPTLAEDTVSRNRRRQPFDLDLTEALIIEQVPDQPARALGDDDRLGFGQPLQPRCKIWRLANDGLLLGGARPDQVADHREPSRQTNADLQWLRDLQSAHRLDYAETGPHRALCVVFMGLRITKIGKHPVAHILGDKPAEPADRPGRRSMVRADHLAQILGIEPRRQSRRADQIAKHHRQLPALGTRHDLVSRDR